MELYEDGKPPVKIRKQEDRTGCGFAAVAMLAGVRYARVKKEAAHFGIDVEDVRLWSETAYVRTLLGQFGIKADSKESPFISWDALPSHALLAIKWHREGRHAAWHWVVFWRSPQGPVVLDPKQSLRNNIRTDFWRIAPKWFIRVEVPH